MKLLICPTFILGTFERAIAIVEALPCDVLVTAHPEGGGLWERKAQQAALGNVAFIDAGACRSYAAKARATLARTLATEAARGKNDTPRD